MICWLFTDLFTLHSVGEKQEVVVFHHWDLEGASESSTRSSHLKLDAFDSVSLEIWSHLDCSASDPTSKQR